MHCNQLENQPRFCGDYNRIRTSGCAEQLNRFGNPSGREPAGNGPAHLFSMFNKIFLFLLLQS